MERRYDCPPREKPIARRLSLPLEDTGVPEDGEARSVPEYEPYQPIKEQPSCQYPSSPSSMI